MTAADYSAVTALWQSCDGIYRHNDYTETAQGFTQILQRNPGLSSIVLHDDKLIATCLCTEDGRRGWIHHLTIAPAFRRQGIAQALVRVALSNFHARNIFTVKLGLLKDNLAGSNFWQKMGFVKENYYDIYSHHLQP